MKIRNWARKVWGDSGQSMVELAAVLPVLVVLVVGIFDMARAIQASNIITNMSREGASLAARTSISPQDVMSSLAATAQPLAMGTRGAIYLTQVSQTSGAATVQLPRSSWRTTSDPELQSRVTQERVAQTLGGITLQDGDSVFVFEVLYRYDFAFGAHSQILYSTTIF